MRYLRSVTVGSDRENSVSQSEERQTPPSTVSGSNKRSALTTPEIETQSISLSLEDLQLSGSGSFQTREEDILSGIDELNIDSDQHSESDSDESDNDNAFYSSEYESLPDAPIYNEKLQDTLTQTKTSLNKLYLAMSRCPLVSVSTSTLSAIAQRTKNLSEFQYSRTRIVGLIGESGVGKSSLINSLLNEKGIARSSGDGGACTNIVTEYRQLPLTITERYYFEVEYVSSEGFRELLEELVLNYRSYFVESLRQTSEESTRSDVKENAAVKEIAERSAAALESIFKGHEEYAVESFERFLQEDYSDSQEKIVEKLITWAKIIQKQRPGGLEASSWSGTARSVDELASKLDIFVRMKTQDQSPVFWPFVSIIRVYLKSRLLETGVVLADLPGLRDLNYARVRATDKYARGCHEILAVAKIDRVTTDVGIGSIINSFGKCSLRIVCTHSEAVNADETKISNPAVATNIKEFGLEITNLRRTLRQLQRDRRKSDGSDLISIMAEILGIQESIKQIQFKEQQFLMQTRNKEVTDSLRLLYSKKVRNENLQVFCVSNKEYSKYQEEDPVEAQPHLELSGIPQLRRHCEMIPAAAQFKAVDGFLQHQVPSLLGAVEQWLLQGSQKLSAERADALRKALESSKDQFLEWDSFLSSLKRDLLQDFRSSILDRMSNNAVIWTREALAASSAWACWPHQSYKAFCSKNGDHTTKTMGYHNWNDEIVWAMREHLKGDWDDFVRQAEERIEYTFEEIREVFDAEQNTLSSHKEFAPKAIRALLKNMVLRLECIRDIFDSEKVHIMETFCSIQEDALQGYPSSYIVRQMRSTYVACQMEGGGGSDARRKGLVRQRLSRPQVFLDLREMVRIVQIKAIKDSIERIEESLRSEFDNLVHDIDNVVCEKGTVSESQRYKVTATKLQDLVDDLSRELEETHDWMSRLREENATL